MDAVLKTEWINALKSGKYTQTNGVLRDCNGWCCLGVFCDVVGISIDEDLEYPGCYAGPNGEYDYPSKDVQNLISKDWDDIDKLSSMNDDGISFEQIADWIEKNL